MCGRRISKDDRPYLFMPVGQDDEFFGLEYVRTTAAFMARSILAKKA
jgi:hypothetical protein